jgi:hypothetical protein
MNADNIVSTLDCDTDKDEANNSQNVKDEASLIELHDEELENLESKKRKCEKMSNQAVNEKTLGDISSAIVETTRSLIVCLICSEVMYPPITNQCSNGHLLCASCSKKCKQKCPVCRDKISHNRNLALETIAGPLVVCCKNESLGCRVNMKYSEIGQHVSECEYEGFECCPFNSCDEKISFYSKDTITKHFRETHSIEVAPERNGNATHYRACLFVRTQSRKTNASTMVVLFEHEGALFLEQVTQINDSIFVRVRGIGKKNKFANSKVVFTIKDKLNNVYSVTEPIKSIHEVYGQRNYTERDAMFKFKIVDLLSNFEPTTSFPKNLEISKGVTFFIKVIHR